MAGDPPQALVRRAVKEDRPRCLREGGCMSLWDEDDVYATEPRSLVALLREVAEEGCRSDRSRKLA